MSIYASVHLDSAADPDHETETWDVAVAIFETDDFLRLSVWDETHDHRIYLTPDTARRIADAIMRILDDEKEQR